MEFNRIYANARQRDFHLRARKAREYARVALYCLIMALIAAVWVDEHYGPIVQREVASWIGGLQAFSETLKGA